MRQSVPIQIRQALVCARIRLGNGAAFIITTWFSFQINLLSKKFLWHSCKGVGH